MEGSLQYSQTDHSGSHVLGGGTTAGMTVICIDPLSSQVTNNWTLPTGTSSQKLVEAVNGIPSGTVVVIAGCGDIVTHLSDQAKRALESVGSSQIQRIKKNDSWALIGIRGVAPGSVCECIVGNAKESVCVLLQDISQYQPSTGEDRQKRFVSLLLLAREVLVGIVSSFVSGIYFTPKHQTLLPAAFTQPVEPLDNDNDNVCKPSKRKALLVGITYSKRQAAFLQKRPPAYARILRATLINTKTFDKHNITVLTDDPEPNDPKLVPSSTNIESILQQFRSSASDDDVYLFYYCGHGGSNNAPPNDPSREEFLKTLNASGNGLYDKRLNEVTNGFPSKCNLTFIFHACFSGGMFDTIPPLPYPMKGIALTSVDGTIPAVLEAAPEAVDITTIVKDTIKDKNPMPTYKQFV